MNADTLKKELEGHLSDVEKFLTSVIQEESKITVKTAEMVDQEAFRKQGKKEDIFVYGKEQQLGNDVILVLDQEWFGLLSSIMLGVEEKTNNEITRDLLTKFSKELAVMLQKKLKVGGKEFRFGDIEVLTLRQMEKRFGHRRYFHVKMEVSGLADNEVRAELLLGDPQADAAKEKGATEGKDAGTASGSQGGDEKRSPGKGSSSSGQARQEPEGSTVQKEKEAGKGEDFTDLDVDKLDEAGKRGSMVDEDDVVSGRRVEFDDFENSGKGANGHVHSMALLKDIEMEVSVQLGQIEMPLGKVLQLSKGSIIELDKLAGEPVDILVNGSKIAHGEVVVIDEHFGVRISNLITTRERIAGLK